MIYIDGSYLEGGGQILRTSLSLSAIRGEPFKITGIRANRPRPGLQPQHLAAVNATAAICNAKVTGNIKGSTELFFDPAGVRSGDYFFDIGTAGSATLLAQTLIPILASAEAESKIIIKGGTHVMKSPSFEYFKYCFIPNIRRKGIKVEAEMKMPGFYPHGGGEMVLRIFPSKIIPYDFVEPGQLKQKAAYFLSANLPNHVLEREETTIAKRLGAETKISKSNHLGCHSTGNAITIVGEFENYCIGADGLGQAGKPAETVAAEVLSAFDAEIASCAPDHNMVDQLMLYLVLAGRGKIKYGVLSSHAKTNIYTISKMTGIRLKIDEEKKVVYL